MYGGGIVETLEERVAGLLGKEAAAFFPSGTMAQQVALRCWAGRTGSTTVALHPLAHPEVHERNAFSTVSGLRPSMTDEPRLPTADEVRDFDGALRDADARTAPQGRRFRAALLGGTVRRRGGGARTRRGGALRRGPPVGVHHPLRPPPGRDRGPRGQRLRVVLQVPRRLRRCRLAGPRTLVEEAKAWRHRYGGAVFQQFPTVLSALVGLDRSCRGSRSTWPTRAWSPRRCARGSQRPGCRGRAYTPRCRTPTSSRSGCRTTRRRRGGRDPAGRGDEDQPVRQRMGPGRPEDLAVTEVYVRAPGLEWTADDVRAAVTEFVARL
jgi:hypothetical protein